MARPRKVKETVQQNSLLSAMQFLSCVTKSEGSPEETHVILRNKQAIAFNGITSAGQLIEQDLISCPHNSTLVQALTKCGQEIDIKQLDENRLSIKSNKFKVIVPCLNPYLLQGTQPDQAIVGIDDRLKDAIEAVSCLTSDNAQKVMYTSVLLNGGSVISTDGKVIFEYWHGLNLPTNIVLPKKFAEALSKIKKKLKAFGNSQSSITLYFEDDSWIKTQLYVEPWPDTGRLLNRPCSPQPLPENFLQAVNSVAPFSPDGTIYLENGVLRSHSSADIGASHELQGLPNLILNSKQFLMLKEYIKKIDFNVDNGKVFLWFGEKCRGAIAGYQK